LCRPLTSIFNLSLRQGFVPSLWKSANVSSVPKSSPAQDIDSDFRPISLTAIVSKILESFTYRWLFQSIAGKIDPLQFGALRGSSASMALVHLLHKWYEACDDLCSSLRICLLDFSKAFDRINHNILLRKLQLMAVHPVLINWIADFLSNRLQRTKIGQDYSAWKYIQDDVINNQTVNIVTHAKLLGVTISNDLKWNLHVNAVCKKASKRLYALQLLKRNALPDPS
jgi:hypothetical protein